MRHGWLKHFHPFHDLETNPATQVKVHVWGQRYWIANIPVVLVLFFFAPHYWIAISLLLNTLWTLYSNWSTDNGAAAALKAQLNTTPSNQQLLNMVLATDNLDNDTT